MDTAVNTELKELLISDFKTYRANMGLEGNLQDIKKEAFVNFEKLGFPSIKNEEYKYINFTPALSKDYAINPESNISFSDINQTAFSKMDAIRLVFVNGKFSKTLSDIKDIGSNIAINSFSETDPQLLEKYFAKPASDAADAFVSLNTAYAEEGTFISIKKNALIEKPIFLLYLTDTSEGNVLTLPRNIIVAEKGAQATFFTSYQAKGDNFHFDNSVIEIFQYQDSIIKYFLLQDESDKLYQVNNIFVHQIEKSNFISNTITLNGAIIRNNLNIILKSEYSEAELYGLTLLKNKTLADNHTVVDHAMPNCQSNELYKSILADKSIGVFNGKIYVRIDAQKTNAFQSNKSILLSADAVMNTKPQLEIFADDVKCSHGATIGQLDEEPLFYLRSRGLKEETAKKLLVLAFARDVVENIKNEELKNILAEIIAEKIS
jgi:Fe-S cluster assembly protein SufD